MYGFGDVQDPLPETITVMEDLLIDYITNLVSFPFHASTHCCCWYCWCFHTCLHTFLSGSTFPVRLSSRGQHEPR